MKRFSPLSLLPLIASLSVIPTYAVDASVVTDGQNFAKSMAPTSPSQVVNPSGANQTPSSQAAWTGQINTPTAPPPSMGAFSTPTNNGTYLANAKSMGLTGLGNQAVVNCKTHVPGADPYKDQACAATNFLTNKCLPTNSKQGQIITNTGNSAPITGDCTGSYGASVSTFNYNNTITPTDTIFSGVASVKDTAGTVAGNSCSVVPSPVQTYELKTCTKSKDMQQLACSQYVNTSIVTEYSYKANTGGSCDGVGSEAPLTTALTSDGTWGTICVAWRCAGNWVQFYGVSEWDKIYYLGAGLGQDYTLLFHKTGSKSTYCTGAVVNLRVSNVSKGGGLGGSIEGITAACMGNAIPGRTLEAIRVYFPDGYYHHMFHGWYGTCYFGPIDAPQCPSGGSLVDGICRNVTTNTTSVSGTTCPPGDSSCVVTQSTTSDIQDTCSASLPPGTVCKKVSQKISWSNDCAGFQSSAGQLASPPTMP